MIRIRIRSSRPSSLTHAFLAKDVVCTCGSTEVQPEPGAFGEVGSSLGFSRFWCRACHRHFWLRSAVLWSSTVASDEEAEADVIEMAPAQRMDIERRKTPRLAALDKLQRSARATDKPTDLTALDRLLDNMANQRQGPPEGTDNS